MSDTRPLDAVQFITQIAPEGADAAWIAQAVFWADLWACAIKTYTIKHNEPCSKKI